MSDKSYAIEGRVDAIVPIACDLVTQSQNNFTAERVIGTWTIPLTDPLLGVLNATYDLVGFGFVSTTGTPNLTLTLRALGLSGGVLVNTGAVATAANLSASGFGVQGKVCTETVGASGKVSFVGGIWSNAPVGSTVFTPGLTRSINIDTTIALVFVVTATWSVASTLNVAATTAGQMTRTRAG